MLTLVLVRHGETEHNAARRYHGHGDAPLTPAGRAQAAALRERLAGLVAQPDTRLVSSDLGRARETARIAFPRRHVTADARLRELNFGTFDGLTHEDCLATHEAVYRAWTQDPSAVRPPGGETVAELEARMLDWLGTQPRSGATVAITHGGPIFALLARLLDVPLDVVRRAGVVHGDGVRLVLPSRSDAPVPDPVWLSDEAAGCGRYRARERLADPDERT